MQNIKIFVIGVMIISVEHVQSMSKIAIGRGFNTQQQMSMSNQFQNLFKSKDSSKHVPDQIAQSTDIQNFQPHLIFKPRQKHLSTDAIVPQEQNNQTSPLLIENGSQPSSALEMQSQPNLVVKQIVVDTSQSKKNSAQDAVNPVQSEQIVPTSEQVQDYLHSLSPADYRLFKDILLQQPKGQPITIVSQDGSRSLLITPPVVESVLGLVHDVPAVQRYAILTDTPQENKLVEQLVVKPSVLVAQPAARLKSDIQSDSVVQSVPVVRDQPSALVTEPAARLESNIGPESDARLKQDQSSAQLESNTRSESDIRPGARLEPEDPRSVPAKGRHTISSRIDSIVVDPISPAATPQARKNILVRIKDNLLEKLGFKVAGKNSQVELQINGEVNKAAQEIEVVEQSNSSPESKKQKYWHIITTMMQRIRALFTLKS